jgi:hypothetical protein
MTSEPTEGTREGGTGERRERQNAESQKKGKPTICERFRGAVAGFLRGETACGADTGVWGTVTESLFPKYGRRWDPTTPALDAKGKELPLDAIDGRPSGEWRSRYPRRVHRTIGAEAVYLIVVGTLMILISVAGWITTHDLCLRAPGPCPYQKVLAPGVLAFGAGGLGGTLFGLKWLYHSTAKGMWHLDRRPWRLFTPWLSSILAVAALALIKANVLTLLSPEPLARPSGLLGVGFLIGYFSDITVGKLNEVALVLFGTQSDRSRRQRDAESVTVAPTGGTEGAERSVLPDDEKPLAAGTSHKSEGAA